MVTVVTPLTSVCVENGRVALREPPRPVIEANLVSLRSLGIVRRRVEEGGQGLRLRSSKVRAAKLLMRKDVAEETLSEDGGRVAGEVAWRVAVPELMSCVSVGPVVYNLKPETIYYEGGARTPLMEKLTTLPASTEATPHVTSIRSSLTPLTNLHDYTDYYSYLTSSTFAWLSQCI